jgi:hypothetical protein
VDIGDDCAALGREVVVVFFSLPGFAQLPQMAVYKILVDQTYYESCEDAGDELSHVAFS